tara:strand:+ start:162 stop:1061 length:900 start_codon:yes stop_codon:yes gene_type:complete
VGKEYFLDCGANVGQSVLHYISEGLITPKTEVHLFEPNPLCVAEAKRNLKEYENYNFKFHTVAVWDENCQKRLTLEYVPNDYTDQYGSGKTINGRQWTGGASNVLGEEWYPPAYIDKEHLKEGELVDCIDFAEFLWETIPSDAAKVYLKMDIEGSEYCVLWHLLESEMWNCITEVVGLEWHDCNLAPCDDPHDHGSAMCMQVNDLLYLLSATSLRAGNEVVFNHHVNVSTSKVKFAFSPAGYMLYIVSDDPLELGKDGFLKLDAYKERLEYHTASSFDQVLERIRKSNEESKKILKPEH